MRILLLALITIGTSTTLSAAAETDSYFLRDRNVGVTERTRPEYDTAPLRMGGFLVSPDLQTDAVWSDNIFASRMSPTSDYIFSLRPSAEIVSSKTLHAVEARFFAGYHRYSDNPGETTTDGGGRLAARLDLQENTSLSLTGHYEFLHQPRSAAASNTMAKAPIAYTDFGLILSAQREFGRVRAIIETGYDGDDFSDGETASNLPIEQDYRDHSELYGRANIGYAFSPAASVFLRGRAETVTFNEKTPFGVDRNQSGYVIELGADFDISNLMRGEIGVGYLTRSFVEPGRGDISGWSLDAEVGWYPMPLITLKAEARRRVRISGLAVSTAYVELAASLRADYEMRRNILLFAEGSIGEDDYTDILLIDSYNSLEAGALWVTNRHLAVSLSARRRTGSRSTLLSAGSRGFDENRIAISLIARP